MKSWNIIFLRRACGDQKSKQLNDYKHSDIGRVHLKKFNEID